jgi:putative membrane protein
MMSLFWLLVIAGLALGVRWFMSQGKEGRSDSALDILRQRYASGEINKEEFEAKKRDLS